MTERLSDAGLARIAASVARPGYDRSNLREGVVHIGLGAFTRAHQCAAFEALANAGDLGWGVVGVSLRSAGVRDALAGQDRLYTLLTRDGDAEHAQIVGILTRLLVAPEDPAAVIAAIAQPSVRLVTLTITEKGYHVDRATKRLDRTAAAVARDLVAPDRPATAAGLIVAALARIRAAGSTPPAIMSCDNLPHNGAMLRAAVLDFASAGDPALAGWIADHVAFPATMVDRIVPATTDRDRDGLASRLGYADAAPVVTEPFTQWVIERAGAPPELARAGAMLVKDVAAWETAKLRMLNGAHSMIAYLGALDGIAHVHDYVGDPARAARVETLWDEMAPTLDPAAGIDLPAYRAALMRRFANPALRHRTVQIAADGSQKLPQRLVAPMVDRRAAGLRSPTIARAIAGWMVWQRGILPDGTAHRVDDPMADRTRAIWAGAATFSDACERLLTIGEIFPADNAIRDDIAAAMREQADKH